MKEKRWISLLLSVLILFGCAACGKIRIHTDDGPSAAESPVSTQTATDNQFYHPLTGQICDADISSERPFAVMVNNISVAQPQIGIANADWIYELEAEGGITRMMALYTNLQDVPSIGSVRSLRPYFLSIAMSYDAIMVHAGGSEDAYADCEIYHWDHLDGVRDPVAYSSVFYRDPNRCAYGTEHSLFVYGNQVSALTDQYGFRRVHPDGFQTGLTFSADAASLCSMNADSVEVQISQSKKTSFIYHSDSGQYTGLQYGGDYIDGATGEPIPFSNLLVLATQVVNSNDDLGHISVDVVGSGTGYFFTGGKATEIHWARDGIDSPFQYTMQNGTPITFTPGKTYCAFISAAQGGVEYY